MSFARVLGRRPLGRFCFQLARMKELYQLANRIRACGKDGWAPTLTL